MQHDASTDTETKRRAAANRRAELPARGIDLAADLAVDDSSDRAVAVWRDERSRYLAGLIERVSKHDAAAFEVLYRGTAPALFALAIRVTHTRESAEDVVQEGFIKIWRFADSYDAQKSSPFTWMSSIVKHQALDYLRRNPLTNVYVEELDKRSVGADSENGVVHHSALDVERLHAYLGRLTPGQRQAIALAYFRGQSQSEIAHTLDAPIGTVKSWIGRGLESLRAMVDGRHAPHHGGSC